MIDVLYYDDDVLVLNKPSGLLSVPGKGEDKQDCLERRAQERFPSATIIHRLDMATSGIMLMALNIDAHRALSRQFEKRQVEKTYVALIDGYPEQENGKIDLPLICDWPNRPRQKVCHDTGKQAITYWKTLQCHDNQTALVELKPVTGRSHQLRVHMLELGHPILGDQLYAPPKTLNKSNRLCLHAKSIKFSHPTSNKQMEFEHEAAFK